MTKKEHKNLVAYWVGSAAADWEAYLSLRKARKYAHALFFLQLTFEKLLKAFIVIETGEHPPFSHNLSYLLGKTSLQPPERYLSQLAEISKFNTQTRYPDEKLAFYGSINATASLHWHKVGTEIRKWLLSSLKKS